MPLDVNECQNEGFKIRAYLNTNYKNKVTVSKYRKIPKMNPSKYSSQKTLSQIALPNSILI